jgi:hypothetical protein
MARVHVPAHDEWTDDLDGSPAARSVELKTDWGSRYRIDLSKANDADWSLHGCGPAYHWPRPGDWQRRWRQDGRPQHRDKSPRVKKLSAR